MISRRKAAVRHGARSSLLGLHLLLTTLAGAAGGLAPAQSASRHDLDPNPFRKTYLGVGLVQNFPQARTQSHMAPGGLQPTGCYMHTVNAHWLMSLGAGLKTLQRPNTDPAKPSPSPTLAIWSLSHTTFYALRLSHPTYLLVGPKLLYLLPTVSGKPPPQRDHQYESEIGAGLSTELVHMMSDRWMLSLHMERWRGVKSANLAGFEFGLGAMIALD